MKDAKLMNAKNIKDYIAKAVAFRREIENLTNLEDKFSRFTYLFPTLEDKMICKAIFDVKFTGDVSTRKFISQMIDGINELVPQKITEMIDLYNQVSALAYKQKIKDNKFVSDSGGERNVVEVKQGTSINDDKHGRIDNFNSFANVDKMTETFGGEVISKHGDSVVSVISKSELEQVKQQLEFSDKIKHTQEQQLKTEEMKKREAYEKSLAERRNKQEYAKISSELQRILNYEDKD